MKKRNWLWFAVPAFATLAVSIAGYHNFGGAGQADTTNVAAKGPKAGDPLPIKQVVLFNAGVGYFQREGDVDGNARVELSFPVGDINDLLKSLVLQDVKGKIGTVNYDSSDPIDKILRSFALDLTGNPTFGQILNQARGEKIEISRSEKKDGQLAKIAGTIIGMEVRHHSLTPSPSPGGRGELHDVEILNLNTATGLQAIPMDQIVSVRFQNPVLENEFQRALQVLARSHDTQKKSVSVGFNGQGKRPVKVGYVLERPIWKTSYRLRIDAKDKVFVQGWALVENTSDDDWNDVRMVLVSGKPIAFRMNLYDPIYVARPFVEPELFASLRPPVYSGALEEEKGERRVERKPLEKILVDVDKAITKRAVVEGLSKDSKGRFDSYDSGMEGMSQVEQRRFMRLADDWGRLPPREQQLAMEQLVQGKSANQKEAIQDYLDFLTEARGSLKKARQDSTGKPGLSKKHREAGYDKNQSDAIEKLEQAKKAGGAITGFNFREGIQSLATAEEVGEYFQYVIDQKITLPRQKSAMLPILDQSIEGHKFSIYNESVHAKYPLLGLKLKNTSGQPLTQGPITVYDGGVFGGDTRILDLQPGEERLLSYALDQGTEVKTDLKQTTSPDLNLTIGAGSLSARYNLRQTKTYTIKNRSTHDRQVLIEHPIRSDWKLADPKKAIETTRDVYRFLVAVPVGKTVTYDVVEDTPRVDGIQPSPPLPGGEGRSVPYAVVDGITVKIETTTDYHKLTGVKIVKGLVLPSHKTRETKAYFIQNLSEIDRTFTVDHVVRPGWVRLDDKNDPQAGPEVFRFKLSVAKGKTGQQAVREERRYTESGTLLKSLSEKTIRDYLVDSATPADVKAAFTKALDLQAKIADTRNQLAELEKQVTILTADHTRVRENLKIIPMTSDHYKTFLEKFVAQDKQIETLQKSVRDLSATLTGQMRDYDQFLARLDAE